VKPGIALEHRNALVNNGYPQRFERFAQIEVIPGADVAYTLRVWYIAQARPLHAGQRSRVDRRHIIFCTRWQTRRRTTSSPTPPSTRAS
jgi:hypothetical protein